MCSQIIYIYIYIYIYLIYMYLEDWITYNGWYAIKANHITSPLLLFLSIDFYYYFLQNVGLKMAEKLFPAGLLTGTPPQPFGAKKKTENITMASQTEFSASDLENLHSYLDHALQDHSIGSM